jgi:hypothetical protein
MQSGRLPPELRATDDSWHTMLTSVTNMHVGDDIPRSSITKERRGRGLGIGAPSEARSSMSSLLPSGPVFVNFSIDVES